ncbi:PREDICTED: codeine O-demethylase-like [Ipomoea nil]|uniref:codeine O-demethylase-like n=1 Tax=Ipomoea nil TaxID=35883 RepID=UPI000900C6A6|nr:PREDICTED: codeine O-demethylase-like [Ipomoea nil]
MKESSESLQELAKVPMLIIPDRYICVNQEPTISSSNSNPSIPTIDLQTLLMEETKDLGLQNLHSACKDWGIFQLVNHGVNPSVLAKLRNGIEEFYSLPLEEKMLYKFRPGEAEGYGQTIVFSDDQKIDWADRFYMITNPIFKRKPHLLPKLPSSLREALEAYILQLQDVSRTLLGFIAQTLKIGKREMEDMAEDGMQSMRMTYYPPCPKPELVTGITPHSDATLITILHQVNGVDGLQVKTDDGNWIPVEFHPADALVVNVGDTLEIFSNGVYKSVEHRVMVDSSKERISIAMFFNAKFEAEIGPARCLINEENPPAFRRMKMEEYVKEFFSRKLDGKSFLDRTRIQKVNAKPDIIGENSVVKD